MEIINIISFSVAISILLCVIVLNIIFYKMSRDERKRKREIEFYHQYADILLERARKNGNQEDNVH